MSFSNNNPNPQHNPTDGLGVAAYVVLSGTNLTNLNGGSVGHPGTMGPVGANGIAGNGQGKGATEGGNGSPATAPGFPVAQYALTLSLSGTGAPTTEEVYLGCVDVENNPYAADQPFVVRSLNNPSAGSPAWYRPSPGSSGGTTGANASGYDADIASATLQDGYGYGYGDDDGVMVVTALSVGQAIVEVCYPLFDFQFANVDLVPAGKYGNPLQFAYAQIVVTVTP